MRIDVLKAELERLDREGRVPKFIYTVPSFQNPAGVTLSLERRRELVRLAARARAAGARGQPVRAAALRGRAAADALLARRRRVRDLPRHVLEDPLARPAAGLDRRARARCSRSSTSARAAPTSARPRCRSSSWPPTSPSATGAPTWGRCVELYRRRRDVMLEALAEHLPRRGDVDAARRRPVHLGAAAGLHRHDRPAGAGAARERRVRAGPRRVPGRPRRLGDAAELLRRRRRRHPRGRAADRQGRARAGRPLLDADRA